MRMNTLLVAIVVWHDVDVIPLGVPNNPKSPYEGVKNPTVFIVKLLFESMDNAPPIFNDNVLNDVWRSF